MKDFTKSADKNISLLENRLRVDANFDILQRRVKMGNHTAGFFFIDGFVQEAMVQRLMQFFYSLKPEDFENVDKFL